jgi:hypothetical protein
MAEPIHHAAPQILQVGEFVEVMALAGIDHQFDRRADGFQRMPVFERLRRRAFDIAT